MTLTVFLITVFVSWQWYRRTTSAVTLSLQQEQPQRLSHLSCFPNEQILLLGFDFSSNILGSNTNSIRAWPCSWPLLLRSCYLKKLLPEQLYSFCLLLCLLLWLFPWSLVITAKVLFRDSFNEDWLFWSGLLRAIACQGYLCVVLILFDGLQFAQNAEDGCKELKFGQISAGVTVAQPFQQQHFTWMDSWYHAFDWSKSGSKQISSVKQLNQSTIWYDSECHVNTASDSKTCQINSDCEHSSPSVSSSTATGGSAGFSMPINAVRFYSSSLYSHCLTQAEMRKEESKELGQLAVSGVVLAPFSFVYPWLMGILVCYYVEILPCS